MPETLKIVINGKLRAYVGAKDVILKIAGMIGADGASYKALEFYGSTIADISMDGRLSISNMAIEVGAKVGIIPPDRKTIDYLERIQPQLNFHAVLC